MSIVIENAKIEINEEHCKGCELCIDACPESVIQISNVFNTKGYHPVYYIGDGCTGCGICFYACPEPDAITVYQKGAVIEEVN